MPNETTDQPSRELATAQVRALIPPSAHSDFVRWCNARGYSISAGVKMLIFDALSRDAHTASNALYRPLPVYLGGEPVAPSGAVYHPACGMFHGRAMNEGEHCDWEVDRGAADLPAPYKPLPD